MIIIERGLPLPKVLEEQKAQVILCLRSMHYFQECGNAADLKDFLDGKVLPGIAKIPGVPVGLSRVVLFYHSEAVLKTVAERMLPGAMLLVYQQPGCWAQLAKQLPDLIKMAQRAEPNWQELQQLHQSVHVRPGRRV